MNTKSSGTATASTDKNAKIELIDKQLKDVNDEIKKEKIDHDKKIRDLTYKKNALMKERRALLPKKKQNESSF